MDDHRQQLLAEAEETQRQFEKTLEQSGLSMTSLRALADRIRQQLPRAERDHVDATARAFAAPGLSCRPGTSDLTALPVGIRG